MFFLLVCHLKLRNILFQHPSQSQMGLLRDLDGSYLALIHLCGGASWTSRRTQKAPEYLSGASTE